MPERALSMDLIVGPPALAVPYDHVRILEFMKDTERSSFRDSDLVCDVADPKVGISHEAHEHVCMVGEERPGVMEIGAGFA
jgi:hypothetical protein